MHAQKRHLGLGSGVGIVIANMVGAGVFLSSGFMAQQMGPGTILLAWLVGAGLALAGSRAYAEVARLVPRSGGEYRFLSDLLHPSLGYLAGGASLLIGFSAPIAIDALAAGAFTATLIKGVDYRIVGVGLVIALTVLHALGLSLSRRTQNGLVIVKSILLLGFVAVGLAFGRMSWPTWSPPTASPGSPLGPVMESLCSVVFVVSGWNPAAYAAGFPIGPFMQSLFYIAFAFSGWNAAAYAAEEFRSTERDVPRAMLLGCLLVAVLYMLVNWVLVANLTPERATAVFSYETSRITLGHLVMLDLIGEAGARVMSVFIIVALVSSMSAMTFVGPRVYAAMAEDGFLPRALQASAGRPPTWSVVLQGALALVILAAQQLAQIMQNLGAILTLFAALTTLSLFVVRFRRRDLPAPRLIALAAAAVYSLSAALMLYFGFVGRTDLLLWLGAVLAITLSGYLVTRRGARAATRA